MNKEFEDIKKKMESIVSENSALKKENAELGKKCDAMTKRLKENEQRLVQCDQYSRRCNIEIKGIPKTESENVTELVFKLGELIGEQIAIADIEACHRVPTRDVAKNNLIVQFQHRQKRDAVLDKAKKKRMTCREFGFPEQSPVYVNEHLCPYMKTLLGMTLTKKREHQWRYVWVRNSKIFARKVDGAPVVVITHEDELEKIG